MGLAGPMLLLATSNPGKRTELLAFLPSGIQVVTLADVAIEMPPEVGASFVEIARKKALFAARSTGIATIADDSGLEVDALAGAPGIYSARYAGEPSDDARNRALLLLNLRDTPSGGRSARFRCAVAFADHQGVIAAGEGASEGTIGFSEVGENGFGYDSLFLLPDGRTMAQLEADEKNRISHRARAYEAIAAALREWSTSTVAGSRS